MERFEDHPPTTWRRGRKCWLLLDQRTCGVDPVLLRGHRDLSNAILNGVFMVNGGITTVWEANRILWRMWKESFVMDERKGGMGWIGWRSWYSTSFSPFTTNKQYYFNTKIIMWENKIYYNTNFFHFTDSSSSLFMYATAIYFVYLFASIVSLLFHAITTAAY